MNLSSRRKDDVELNLTPVIDVVFLLLIFFMVSTTTFERESEINITLPKATEEYTEVKPDAVIIDVDVQGRVFIDKQALVNSQLSTIREAIRDAIQGREDPPIIISADAEATHQLVIKVMDAARQVGLVKITFATQRLEEEEL